MAQIGFAGLGRMGFPMARNLVKAGHQVTAYDVDRGVYAAAEAEGVRTAESIEAAVAAADVVISMVPTGAHVLQLHLGEGGGFAHMRKGALAIDCSTIAVSETRAFHEAGGAQGVATLDAPVSGGVMGSQAGTLTFMVGGEAEHFERARPILEGMGRNFFHAGAAGAGQAAKICNNLLAGISMIAVSEAYALADRMGLDAAKMREIVSVSSGGCYSLTHYPPVPDLLPNVPSSRGYQNGFASELMLKDLRLAERAAMESGLPLPLGGMAAAIYGMFCNSGHKQLDYSGIINLLR